MAGRRLTEKVRSWEQNPNRRVNADRRSRIDSVLEYLQRLLNTRQGSVEVADDLGMPDLLHLLQNYPESVREIEQSIRTTINKYEPRLYGIRVSFLPQQEHQLTLHFQIRAQMADEEGAVLSFETLLDPDGRISLKR